MNNLDSATVPIEGQPIDITNKSSSNWIDRVLEFYSGTEITKGMLITIGSVSYEVVEVEQEGNLVVAGCKLFSQVKWGGL